MLWTDGEVDVHSICRGRLDIFNELLTHLASPFMLWTDGGGVGYTFSHRRENPVRKRRILALAMPACLAVSLFSVAYPIYAIRPFRYQGARELALALVVARFRPVVTAAMAIAAVLTLMGYWRGGAAHGGGGPAGGGGGVGLVRGCLPGPRQHT